MKWNNSIIHKYLLTCYFFTSFKHVKESKKRSTFLRNNYRNASIICFISITRYFVLDKIIIIYISNYVKLKIEKLIKLKKALLEYYPKQYSYKNWILFLFSKNSSTFRK